VPQRTGVDAALEDHHVFQRIPEVDPAPVVKLGLVGQVQAQVRLGAGELQQEPHLLLADADHAVAAPDRALRQPVAQPAWSHPEHGDVLRLQAGLFLQLAVHRLQRRLVGVHPALRELPAVTPHAPRPEHATVGVHQNDADIGSETVRIDHDADSKGLTFVTVPDSATRGVRGQAKRPELTPAGATWTIGGSPRPIAALAM
jgi:hypothetical protein